MSRALRAAAAIITLAAAACSEAPLAPPTPIADLPPDLAAVTFTAEGTPTAPYTMLELRQTGGFTGFVAVDGAGRPVWFFRTQGTSSGFTRRANGNFVFLDGNRGLVEVNRAGRVVRELAQQARPGRRIHHDVVATPRRTVLFLAEDWQPWDGGLLMGESLWEWHPESGAVAKQWSSFDHLDPQRDWGARSNREDWLHANSVSYGPRGNVLVSFHYLNQVISLSPDLKRIEWRLGGVGASLPVDDPFSGQHTAQEVGTGRVLLFDNGYERTAERYSRAMELELRGDAAAKVWEWRPPHDNWARIISSARRLPNGNSLVGFGTSRDWPAVGTTGPIEVYEVTPGGAVVWHLVVSGAVTSMYRATPLQSF
jgi:hypothetical protein